MAYIGQRAAGTTAQSRTLDTMTGDGSTNTLTLSQTPDSVMNVIVYYDGVMQRPDVEYTLSGNTLTFTTAPESGVVVYAMTGGAEDIGSPMAGSVTLDTIVDNAITNNKIVSMSSSKLTGALPALDGSNLTGLSSTIDTKSANDPAIDTNPSAVGHLWANTTSGEMFVCTDNTAGENVWYNIGSGSGDVQPYVYSYYGTQHGYVAGGDSSTNVINRFSFTSQTDAADVGDLTTGRGGTAGGKSSTHGFVQGDGDGAGDSNEIEKYTFASSANGTLHGDLTQGQNSPAEASNETHIYIMGGDGAQDNLIQKTATATDSNASNIGTLVNSIWYVGGSSSTTHGYCAGGFPSNNIIQKFSFSVDGDSTDIANLVTSRRDTMGTSSATHGYSSGGFPNQNNIEKFTFASNSDATDVGDMVDGDDLGVGVSAEDYSYIAGGRNFQNRIQRWSHSSDGNAVDWADLTVNQNFVPAGSQY